MASRPGRGRLCEIQRWNIAREPRRNRATRLCARQGCKDRRRSRPRHTGEPPFEPAVAFAQSHGKHAIIDRITTVSDQNVAAQERALKTEGIAATLRLLNDPVAADHTHGLYRELLEISSGDDQPGLEVTATWYRRNLGICAKLLQATKPGDRMVVFIGAGHLTLLQQCVRETPGYSLIDARDYLPR